MKVYKRETRKEVESRGEAVSWFNRSSGYIDRILLRKRQHMKDPIPEINCNIGSIAPMCRRGCWCLFRPN
jgi:hypothetical protein